MPHPKSKITLALEKLDKNVWYDMDFLKFYIEHNVELTEEDWKPTRDREHLISWVHDLYTALSHMTLRDKALHEPEVSAKDSPDGIEKPAKYMFIKKPVAERKSPKRPADSAKYKEAFSKLEKNKWFTIPEIISQVESLITFEDYELEYDPKAYCPVWQRKVRVYLNQMKDSGLVDYQKQVSKTNSPTGKFIPAMYKFL